VASDAKSTLALWHLLSLDAPTVAALWTWFIARVCHIHLPLVALFAMAIAVWMLYVADRLLDVRGSDHGALEVRHYFHHRHRVAFLTGIAAASVLLAILLPRLPSEAIRLYLILGGLVFGYFIVIHATKSASRLPKEIAVGICFAAAVFIPTISRAPTLRPLLLLPALLFAALCSLNCLFIYVWEHPTPGVQPPHPITNFALRYLIALTMTIIVVGTTAAIFDASVPRFLYAATAISGASLLGLHLRRHQHRTLTLRTAADLALLTPALLVPFL